MPEEEPVGLAETVGERPEESEPKLATILISVCQARGQATMNIRCGLQKCLKHYHLRVLVLNHHLCNKSCSYPYHLRPEIPRVTFCSPPVEVNVVGPIPRLSVVVTLKDPFNIIVWICARLTVIAVDLHLRTKSFGATIVTGCV